MTRTSSVSLPTGLLIDGECTEQTSAGESPHRDPATGQENGVVHLAGASEVDAAVRAARAALPHWRSTSPTVRRDILLRLAALIEAEREQLGAILLQENGTPAAFAELVSSAMPAEWLRYYAGWADKLEGRCIPTGSPNTVDYTIPEPFGVVGAITAYNSPAWFFGSKVGPALAAGNTVVLKPSELAPFTSLRLGQLALDAGLPPGVLNVVPGDGRAGAALASHPDVDKLSFTGGSRAGTAVLRAAAEHLTPVILELGGKSSSVIFSDADLDQAIECAVQIGLAIQTGQACIAGSRLLVERTVHDEVVAAIVERAEALTVGPPALPTTAMGPLITDAHCSRVLAAVQQGVTEGAGKLLTGGQRLGGELAEGFFVQPTVFSDVEPRSALATEEIFGPVLAIIPFESEEEAVALSNATDYGLAGYIFTNNVGRAHRVAASIDAGCLCINTLTFLPASAPFGGFKNSGFGREGGEEGIREMTRTKNVLVRLD